MQQLIYPKLFSNNVYEHSPLEKQYTQKNVATKDSFRTYQTSVFKFEDINSK